MSELSEGAMAYDYFSDPASYAPFNLTARHQRVIGCIDPRDQDTGYVPTIVQTPGGAGIGDSHDAALVYAARNDVTTPITNLVSAEREARPASVLSAHLNTCKFLYGQSAILNEQAEPSQMTWQLMTRWLRQYQSLELIRQFVVIAEAARRQRDSQTIDEPEAVLAAVDDAYPEQSNVVPMRGDSNPQAYIVNHHPHVGLNRNKLHRIKRHGNHAYHDSLGAMVNELSQHTALSGQQRGLRLAALLSRSAATRTVLTQGNDLPMLEVYPAHTPSGLKIELVA